LRRCAPQPAARIPSAPLSWRSPRLKAEAFAAGNATFSLPEILSLAYLLTMNPLAAVGHSIIHGAAVVKGTELPPHQEQPVPMPERALAR
jgi:hypothetical protein